MLRPHQGHTLTCPQCEQPGLHSTADACIEALRAAVAGEAPRLRPSPRPVPLAKPRPTPAPATSYVDPSKPLTMRQACELVQVTRTTLYNWRKLGKIDWEYSAGGAVRIQRASLFRAKREG